MRGDKAAGFRSPVPEGQQNRVLQTVFAAFLFGAALRMSPPGSLILGVGGHTERKRAKERGQGGTMKVKTISRVEESYTRDCKGDRLQVHRNRDPSLHPFEKVWLCRISRTYTRQAPQALPVSVQ